MDISLNSLKQLTGKVLHRYHLVIFVVIVFGALIAVMVKVNIIIQSSSANNVTTTAPPPFDQKTIDHIRQLRGPGQSSSPLQTSGRSNPFVE